MLRFEDPNAARASAAADGQAGERYGKAKAHASPAASTAHRINHLIPIVIGVSFSEHTYDIIFQKKEL